MANTAAQASSTPAKVEYTIDGAPEKTPDVGKEPSLIIDRPFGGEQHEIVTIEHGKSYVLNFNAADVASADDKDGNLTLHLKDGTDVTLQNYSEATHGADAAQVSFMDGNGSLQGLVVTTSAETPNQEELIAPQAEIREAQQQPENTAQDQGQPQQEAAPATETKAEELAKAEPQAGNDNTINDIAQKLAQVEPAAGESAASGRTSNSGYGFNSDFNPTPLQGIGPVGVIGATSLQYNANFPQIQVTPPPQAQQAAAPDFNPIIGDVSALQVDESDLGGPGTGTKATGQVEVNFGADGPGSITFNGEHTSSVELTSCGSPVTITQVSGGYIGVDAQGNTIFTLLMDPQTGQYSFTLLGPLDHPNGSDPNDLITLQFGVTATDGDGDSVSTTITINVADDGPSVDGNSTVKVSEDGTAGSGETYVSGDMHVDFGADGAGSIAGNGDTHVGGSVGPGGLTSDGVPVTIVAVDGGYIGVNANGIYVFMLEMNQDGTYKFTLFSPLDHANGNNPHDVISLQFGFTVTDCDGDHVNTTVTINVTDSGPVIDVPPSAQAVDESNLGPVSVEGAVHVDFGSDGFGGVAGNGDTHVGGSVGPDGLTSGGVPVTITAVNGGYVGVDANGTVIFTLEMNNDGTYKFTLLGPLDHANGNNPNDMISLQFGFTFTDGDGDSVTTSVTINVADDGPSVDANSSGSVDEGDLVGTDGTMATGNLHVDFGADGAGSITGNGDTHVGGSVGPGGLTSDGVPVSIVAVDGGYVGVNANGVYIFTLEINQDGTYKFTLLAPLDHANTNNPNDIISLQFGVTVTDGDGDHTNSTITINVADDGPSVVTPAVMHLDETAINHNGPIHADGALNIDYGSDGQGHIEANGNVTTTGSVGPDGLTSGGHPVTVTATDSGYVGTDSNGNVIFTLQINANGTYSFTQFGPLDHANPNTPHDVLRINFGVTITDGDGDPVTTTITVAIADDGPTIDAVVTKVADEGTLFHQGALSVGGTIHFDYGTDGPGEIRPTGNFMALYEVGGQNQQLMSAGHPITVSATANGYVGTTPDGTVIFQLTFNSQTGQYNYQQFGQVDHPGAGDPDDVIWLKFQIAITDADGDTAYSFVQIDLHDSGPIAVDDSNSTDSTDTISGNVVLNDESGLDHTDHPVTQVEFNGTVYHVPAGGEVTVTGQYGTLVMHSDGTYTYTAFGNAEGTDQFTYTYTDFDGDSDTAHLNIHVDTDATPIVTQPDFVLVDETNLEAGGGQTFVEGHIDVDFGGDGPGTFAANGDAYVENPAGGGTLTSHGVPVTITTMDGGYVGTDASGNVIFTLTFNTDGTYKFTLLGTLDHGNPNTPNDVIALHFGVGVTDADGDYAATIVTVYVADDGPTINGSFAAVDEDGLVGSDGITVTGNLDVHFGADGAGEIRPAGEFIALYDQNGTAQPLYSGGQLVHVQTDGYGYTGSLPDGTIVFQVLINPQTGQYTYNQFAPLDHPDTSNPDDVIWLKFAVQITDADGDTSTSYIGIDVHDSGPVAYNDKAGSDGIAGHQTEGNVVTNDYIGADHTDHPVSAVQFHGVTYNIPEGGSVTVVGDHGTLVMHSDGSYTYTANGTSEGVDDFTYTLVDGDGDAAGNGSGGAGGHSSGHLEIVVDAQSTVVVGSNSSDTNSSTTPHEVGGGHGSITGGGDSDILVGDTGGAHIVQTHENFNIEFILDVSGSMGESTDPASKLSLLKEAIHNLIEDMSDYQGGEVNVHFTLFSTLAESGPAFDITTPQGLQNALNFIDALTNQHGVTNYEAALQTAISWLQGAPADATNITYFLSDGLPNSYMNSMGGPQGSTNPDYLLAQINGQADGTDELGQLLSLSSQVIGIGLGSDVDMNVINLIDSDHNGIYVQDPNQLHQVFADNNPLNVLNATGDDRLIGNGGDDIMFGDALNTDALADAQGLNTPRGAGWEVFTRLEHGEGNGDDWTRADTIEYIRTHALELAQESVNSMGHGRVGGDDLLVGGAGDDLMFGQEGDDTLVGGEGNDILYGGSGHDIFLYTSANDGVDHIMDFTVGEDAIDVTTMLLGHFVSGNSISNYIFLSEVNGSTVVSVDLTGSGNPANATPFAILDGVTGLTLADVILGAPGGQPLMAQPQDVHTESLSAATNVNEHADDTFFSLGGVQRAQHEMSTGTLAGVLAVSGLADVLHVMPQTENVSLQKPGTENVLYAADVKDTAQAFAAKPLEITDKDVLVSASKAEFAAKAELMAKLHLSAAKLDGLAEKQAYMMAEALKLHEHKFDGAQLHVLHEKPEAKIPLTLYEHEHKALLPEETSHAKDAAADVAEGKKAILIDHVLHQDEFGALAHLDKDQKDHTSKVLAHEGKESALAHLIDLTDHVQKGIDAFIEKTEAKGEMKAFMTVEHSDMHHFAMLADHKADIDLKAELQKALAGAV